MKHFKASGFLKKESDVYQFFSIEEMEKHKTDCVNWKYCLKDARKYLGKICHKNEIRYLINGKPIYKLYKIIGFEENHAYLDYYWIIRPIGATDDKNDTTIIWGYPGFKENILHHKRKISHK